MKNNEMTNFDYHIVESTIINYKTVEVTYRYQGQIMKRYLNIKEGVGVNYINEAKKIIDAELNSGKLETTSHKTKHNSWKAAKIALVTTLGVGAITFSGLYAWKHFQNINDQHSIVVNKVVDMVNSLTENSTWGEISAVVKAYEKMSDEELASFPAEAKAELDRQVNLYHQDEAAAKDIQEEVVDWVRPAETANVTNEYIPIMDNVRELINRYKSEMSERAKKLIEVDNKEKIDQYVEIVDIVDTASRLRSAVEDHLESCSLEDVGKLRTRLQEVSGGRYGQFFNAASDQEGYINFVECSKIVNDAVIRIQADREEAVIFVNGDDADQKGIKYLVDDQDPSYIDVREGTITDIVEEHDSLTASRPRLVAYINEEVKKLELEDINDFPELINKAVNLLVDDEKIVLDLFTEFWRIKNNLGIDPVETSIEKLNELDNRFTQMDGTRAYAIAGDEGFAEEIAGLRNRIETGAEVAEEIAGEVILAIDDMNATCDEDELDELIGRYEAAESFVQMMVDNNVKSGTESLVSNFYEAVVIARKLLNEDIEIVTQLNDKLNNLIESVTLLPTDNEDPNLSEIEKAYKQLIAEGQPRYIRRGRLFADNGFTDKLKGLQNDIQIGNNLFYTIKLYNNHSSTVCTKEQIDKLVKDHDDSSALCQRIVDKLIFNAISEGSLDSFTSWEQGIQHAYEYLKTDEEIVNKLCADLDNLVNRVVNRDKEITVKEIQDTAEILTKDSSKYSAQYMRVKLMLTDKGFNDKLGELNSAINTTMIDELVSYTSDDTLCTSKQIDDLNNRYQGEILKGYISIVLDRGHTAEVYEFGTWADGIALARNMLAKDTTDAENMTLWMGNIDTNTDLYAKKAAASILGNREDYKNLSIRAKSLIGEETITKFANYFDGIKEKVAVAAPSNTIVDSLSEGEAFDSLAGTVRQRRDINIGIGVVPITGADVNKSSFKYDTSTYTDRMHVTMKLSWESTETSVDCPTVRIVRMNGGEVAEVIAEHILSVLDNDKYFTLSVNQAAWDLIPDNDTIAILIYKGTDPAKTDVDSVNLTISDFYQNKPIE